MKASYAKMSYNVCKAIKSASVGLEDLKDFVISYNSSLTEELQRCDTVSSVLHVVDKECSLVDITLFHIVVKNFKVAQAEEYTEDYQTSINSFCHSVSIAQCIEENFTACQLSPESQRVLLALDWLATEHKLEDVTNLLSKISDIFQLVLVKMYYASHDTFLLMILCKFRFPHLFSDEHFDARGIIQHIDNGNGLIMQLKVQEKEIIKYKVGITQYNNNLKTFIKGT